jgi:hypothetical protein
MGQAAAESNNRHTTTRWPQAGLAAGFQVEMVLTAAVD